MILEVFSNFMNVCEHLKYKQIRVPSFPLSVACHMISILPCDRQEIKKTQPNPNAKFENEIIVIKEHYLPMLPEERNCPNTLEN